MPFWCFAQKAFLVCTHPEIIGKQDAAASAQAATAKALANLQTLQQQQLQAQQQLEQANRDKVDGIKVRHTSVLEGSIGGSVACWLQSGHGMAALEGSLLAAIQTGSGIAAHIAGTGSGCSC
jgi:hypothetical protein